MSIKLTEKDASELSTYIQEFISATERNEKFLEKKVEELKSSIIKGDFKDKCKNQLEDLRFINHNQINSIGALNRALCEGAEAFQDYDKELANRLKEGY